MVHIVELHADGTEEQLTQLPDDDMAEADGSLLRDAEGDGGLLRDAEALKAVLPETTASRSVDAPAQPDASCAISAQADDKIGAAARKFATKCLPRGPQMPRRRQ